VDTSGPWKRNLRLFSPQTRRWTQLFIVCTHPGGAIQWEIPLPRHPLSPCLSLPLSQLTLTCYCLCLAYAGWASSWLVRLVLRPRAE